MTDVTEHLNAAEAAVDAAREIFVNELGAAPALHKGSGDFATAADLAVEELLRDKLTGATGIGVFGEEQGGELDEHACWVVDPIDGTSNYSTGNPNWRFWSRFWWSGSRWWRWWTRRCWTCA